jgi:hypothetical protein
MSTLPPRLRIANTAAVLDGPYGAVSQQAERCGLCRQALYRDAPRVLQAVDGAATGRHLQELRDEIDRLRAEGASLRDRLQQAVLVDADSLAHFASKAQAEGVSLPVARRLLGPLLAKSLAPEPRRQPRLPSVARLGRLARAAAVRSAPLLQVLDGFSRDRVRQGAGDEIFFGKKPCLMVVEQHSLCWVTGRLTEQRDGATWAREFRQLPHLEQLTRDGGTGLRKGLALVNAERQQQSRPAIAAQEDHFHALREGRRALRRMQGRVRRLLEKAEEAERRQRQKVQRCGSRQGVAAAVARAWRKAEQAMDAWSRAEQAWTGVTQGVRLVTPAGDLNTRARAEAVIQAALPAFVGPEWSKARRLLVCPQLLTFLDRVQEKRAALSAPPAVVEAALQVEGLRRQPEGLRGEGVKAGALRGVLLAAGLVLTLSGEAGARALAEVRQILDGAWRASSLVECINSVARMQQSRHRRMTQELLDLKRLYWNCRAFRTGPRRQRTPYELLGIKLPTTDWWELLKMTPEQLRQQLSAPGVAA